MSTLNGRCVIRFSLSCLSIFDAAVDEEFTISGCDMTNGIFGTIILNLKIQKTMQKARLNIFNITCCPKSTTSSSSFSPSLSSD